MKRLFFTLFLSMCGVNFGWAEAKHPFLLLIKNPQASMGEGVLPPLPVGGKRSFLDRVRYALDGLADPLRTPSLLKGPQELRGFRERDLATGVKGNAARAQETASEGWGNRVLPGLLLHRAARSSLAVGGDRGTRNLPSPVVRLVRSGELAVTPMHSPRRPSITSSPNAGLSSSPAVLAPSRTGASVLPTVLASPERSTTSPVAQPSVDSSVAAPSVASSVSSSSMPPTAVSITPASAQSFSNMQPSTFDRVRSGSGDGVRNRTSSFSSVEGRVGLLQTASASKSTSSPKVSPLAIRTHPPEMQALPSPATRQRSPVGRDGLVMSSRASSNVVMPEQEHVGERRRPLQRMRSTSFTEGISPVGPVPLEPFPAGQSEQALPLLPASGDEPETRGANEVGTPPLSRRPPSVSSPRRPSTPVLSRAEERASPVPSRPSSPDPLQGASPESFVDALSQNSNTPPRAASTPHKQRSSTDLAGMPLPFAGSPDRVKGAEDARGTDDALGTREETLLSTEDGRSSVSSVLSVDDHLPSENVAPPTAHEDRESGSTRNAGDALRLAPTSASGYGSSNLAELSGQTRSPGISLSEGSSFPDSSFSSDGSDDEGGATSDTSLHDSSFSPISKEPPIGTSTPADYRHRIYGHRVSPCASPEPSRSVDLPDSEGRGFRDDHRSSSLSSQKQGGQTHDEDPLSVSMYGGGPHANANVSAVCASPQSSDDSRDSRSSQGEPSPKGPSLSLSELETPRSASLQALQGTGDRGVLMVMRHQDGEVQGPSSSLSQPPQAGGHPQSASMYGNESLVHDPSMSQGHSTQTSRNDEDDQSYFISAWRVTAADVPGVVPYPPQPGDVDYLPRTHAFGQKAKTEKETTQKGSQVPNPQAVRRAQSLLDQVMKGWPTRPLSQSKVVVEKTTGAADDAMEDAMEGGPTRAPMSMHARTLASLAEDVIEGADDAANTSTDKLSDAQVLTGLPLTSKSKVEKQAQVHSQRKPQPSSKPSVTGVPRGMAHQSVQPGCRDRDAFHHRNPRLLLRGRQLDRGKGSFYTPMSNAEAKILLREGVLERGEARAAVDRAVEAAKKSGFSDEKAMEVTKGGYRRARANWQWVGGKVIKNLQTRYQNRCAAHERRSKDHVKNGQREGGLSSSRRGGPGSASHSRARNNWHRVVGKVIMVNRAKKGLKGSSGGGDGEREVPAGLGL
ncbi:hypothetical protein EIL50_02210 [bacterium NHP-B]|nr:hypothetical protein EIL50_02210 [bacterium NHP-B]